ncbi:MAG: cysteine hydrolase [Chloroflexota bacterium]|nr:cysteine hydrolase [Chloroflexota bacterium]
MSTTNTGRLGHDGDGRAVYLPGRDAGLGLSPQRTALLVIDPVNDFLSEGGAGWDLVKNTVRLHDVVGNLRCAIEGARERGVPVLFGPMAYTEQDYTDKQLHRRSGINRLMFERKMFLAGSWGADFHPDLRPREEETVLLPHKGIDVFETDLPDHLQRMGITHLVIAGMTAGLCCESTGRHAMEEGYDVTYLSDAIGAESIPAYEAAIRLSYPLVGNAVMEVGEFLAAVGASTDIRHAVQPGDTVCGSDRGEIGTVEEVVEATQETEAYMLVPRGLILKQDTYIPLDAVVRRTGTEVFINVPKLIVGEMPWTESPSRSNRQAKLGPRGQDVEKLYGSRSPSTHERLDGGYGTPQ